MCVYIYIYMYVYVYIYIHTHTHTHKTHKETPHREEAALGAGAQGGTVQEVQELRQAVPRLRQVHHPVQGAADRDRQVPVQDMPRAAQALRRQPMRQISFCMS